MDGNAMDETNGANGPDDVVLPAFEMDCRDWLVATPEEAGLADEIDGAPLLAVLSTAIVDEADLQSVSAVVTVGLLDEDAPVAVAPAPGCVAAEVLEPIEAIGDDEAVVARYLVPAPCGKLALLAEFTVRTGAEIGTGAGTGGGFGTRRPTDPELSRRIEALMTSFRWAA